MHGAVTVENVSSFLPPVVAARTYSAAKRSYGGLDVAPSEEKNCCQNTDVVCGSIGGVNSNKNIYVGCCRITGPSVNSYEHG